MKAWFAWCRMDEDEGEYVRANTRNEARASVDNCEFVDRRAVRYAELDGNGPLTDRELLTASRPVAHAWCRGEGCARKIYDGGDGPYSYGPESEGWPEQPGVYDERGWAFCSVVCLLSKP